MKAAATVDAYLAALPPATRKVLQKVRAIVKAAAPDLDEVIAYQMPGWRFDGRPVLYAAGWQQHWSLYPAGRNVAAVFGAELARYEVAKGTIRFQLDELPEDLLARIVKHRAAEARAEAAARALKKMTTKKAVPKTTTKQKTATPKTTTKQKTATKKKATKKAAATKKKATTKTATKKAATRTKAATKKKPAR